MHSHVEYSVDPGAVIIGVDTNSSSLFSIISPEDNVYVDDCLSSRPLKCSGIFHFQKTLSVIEHLITQLSNNRMCSRLGGIDFDPCSDPTMVVTATPTPSPYPSQTTTGDDATSSVGPYKGDFYVQNWCGGNDTFLPHRQSAGQCSFDSDCDGCSDDWNTSLIVASNECCRVTVAVENSYSM